MKSTLLACIGFIVGASICSPLCAENLAVHGFLAQGISSSIDSDFITSDDQISAELTELGVNANYILNKNVSVAGQLVYVDGGNRYRKGFRLDYLFIDWRAAQLFDWQLNVSVGRYKNNHWLHSATQDVPQTRPSITLPQSIYYDGNRDVALSSDGIAVHSSRITTAGTLDLRWSYGRSTITKYDTQKLLGPMASGRVKQDFVHQMSAFWQPSSMQWQLGTSILQSDFTYKPADQDFLLSGNSIIERVTVAARYDSDKWEFASELLRDRLRYQGGFTLGVPLVVDKTGEGGYIQWRYFVNPQLTTLLRFDTYDLDRKDRSGLLLTTNSQGAIPQHYGYMDTLTIGMNWNFHPQFRLSGEFSRTRGAARLSPVLLPESLVFAKPYWSAWAVELMYWF